MKCQDLAASIERLQPNANAREVARLCLLLTNSVPDIQALSDDQQLAQAWQETGWRLQLASDQHAAMTEELEELASAQPDNLSINQIWVLVKAFKVQSQILHMYLGQLAAG